MYIFTSISNPIQEKQKTFSINILFFYFIFFYLRIYVLYVIFIIIKTILVFSSEIELESTCFFSLKHLSR